MLIDTHAHLDYPQFDQDRDEVIRRAFDAKVGIILSIGTDIESSKKTIEISESYENVYATAGVHPHNAQYAKENFIESLREIASLNKVVALGEIGLDFYREYSSRDMQIDMFRKQIHLAMDLGLPIIVHNRNADLEVITILKEEGASEVGGVLHCFSGSLDMALRGVEMDFYASFGGAITYRKSKALKVATGMPFDRVLFETDCPYQSPSRIRGERNEPSSVLYVAEKLSRKMDLSFEEVARKTTDNALRLFGLEDDGA